jgi:hypothetical protein
MRSLLQGRERFERVRSQPAAGGERLEETGEVADISIVERSL